MPTDQILSQSPSISAKRDAKGRFAERTARLGGVTETRRYAYDSAGRLSRVTDESGALCESYQYDHQGRRLADINPLRFRGERRYTYLSGNRLGQAGSVQYGHDKAGFRNLKWLGDDETRYHYEPSGLLLRVDLPDGRRIDYAYDAKGQRTEKRIDGRVVEAYRWLDPLRLSEFHDGREWWRLAYDSQRPGRGSRTPIGVTNGDDSYFLLCDQTGTPLALATTDGHVVQAMQYDSFGNLLQTRGDAVRLPLGFAGGLFDPDTGLTRFVWRDYDADTGRFTALDPLGKKGGDDDWYGYCVDDPVNQVDVWGLEDEAVSNSSGSGDPAKEAGGRIVGKGIFNAAKQAQKGYKLAEAAGAAVRVGAAAARGALGLGTGMLTGVLLEYPPVQEALEDGWEWFDKNYKPTNDGTMQD